MKEEFPQLEGEKCPEKSTNALEFIRTYFGGFDEFEEEIIKKMAEAREEGINVYSKKFEDIVLEGCTQNMKSNVENALRGNIRGIVHEVQEKKTFGKDEEKEVQESRRGRTVNRRMIREAKGKEKKRKGSADMLGIDKDEI